MGYMLDTNTCINLIKHRPASIQKKLSSIAVGEVAVSSMVAAELWYGVANSRKKKENQEALEDFFHHVDVLHWPKEAARLYGEIRTELKRNGTPIGAMDLLIAVHGMFLNTILVTDNEKEFAQVPGLKIENWVNR
ncbi:MAG: type II toxin-antitoxin system VapC family toxin [Desulfobacteraceae bacterium]|nr:MAG: type II toxin-antitoxin system VapC family toxin [Desulfobacteraceae bacterium]